MPTEEELQGGFNLGEWEILPGHGELRRGDEVRCPEPKQFGVLIALAKRDTNVVTKQELVDEVWDGRATADEPITRCVSQLRGHLDDRQTPHRYIETLQRRGYRLKQSVALHKPAVPETATTPEPAPRPRLWKWVAAILAFAVVALAFWLPTSVRSIAVMPFENLSGEPNDQYLVSGFKVALVQALHGMDDYTVKIGVDSTTAPPDLAALLDVSSVLTGSVQREGNLLRVSYVISTAGEVEFSNNVDGSADDLFALQQKLARMVRDDLGDKLLPVLIKSHRPDSVAYDSYMRGMFALEHRPDQGKLESAIELFQDAIKVDDKYGPSYLGLATAYSLLPNYRGASPEEMDRLALEWIGKGIVADATIKDAAGAIYGYVYHKQKRWADSEVAFLRAINAHVVDSNAFNSYSRMLASVGRLDDSLTQALAGLEIDPSSTFLNSRVAMSYAWLGQNQKALKYYQRASAFGWNGSTHILGYALILIQTGEIETAKNLAMSTVKTAGASTEWVGPVFDAFGDATKANAALAVLDKVTAVASISPRVELTARAMLGDLDGAMRVAAMLEQPGEAFEMDLLFIPQTKALRQHPDFMPLMDKLGITRYWQSNGCSWNGDQVRC